MDLAKILGVIAAALAALLAVEASAQAPLPRFDEDALLVDGEPFLMLGAQPNNSSNYAAMLDEVWPTVERLGANTVLMPVAWEQVEPEEGRFDFSFVDVLLDQARARDMRLVLLWYGTWKNTGPSYVPAWVKRDTARFTRMRKADGSAHVVLSPHGQATMQADARAFAALMRHLAQVDPQHTVVMVQVENESGSWGLDRDHAPEAQALFAGPIPQELAAGLGIERQSWTGAFGTRAAQFFNSWYVARYIDTVAAAGQAQKNLPMFVNAALGDAFSDEGGDVGPSGGPNWNALPVWRIAAPHISAFAPDIYSRDPAAVVKYLDRYAAAGPLMVPEIGNAAEYARFVWPAMGRGAVLFSPFGIDGTGYSNYPLGAKQLDEETLEAFAAPYRLFAQMPREWARIARDRPLWGTARGEDGADQTHRMGRWALTAQYGRWAFGEDDWTWIERDPHPLADVPTGGLVAAQLAENVFLVGGRNVKLRIALAEAGAGQQGEIIEAQEGRFVDGEWVMRRRWNGDQIDYGFNFGAEPVWLRIEMGVLE
ncbi:DUF5597 domain-containing protein [Alteriqipengyuania lutimaris]|uniref:DUF5597 domain-containing protein n=1 Tax=Alteriqipengyuania lutimaris TaxID=1538146 RepID=UPI001F3256E6|nr:DUF5597 domain-containing protein [Alteriqipengyuania lutimaris]